MIHEEPFNLSRQKPNRDWPTDTRYLCKCRLCEERYLGPKGSFYCHVCTMVIESKQFTTPIPTAQSVTDAQIVSDLIKERDHWKQLAHDRLCAANRYRDRMITAEHTLFRFKDFMPEIAAKIHRALFP